MSGTFATSHANTFTITNAEYLASKIKTDLMRLHRYYGRPSLGEIENYHKELMLLQMLDLLDEITYGFMARGEWVKALRYRARQGGVLTSDDDPGGVSHTILPEDAKFSSFLVHNERWNSALDDRQKFLRQTPIHRGEGEDYLGNWSHQKAYSSGGRGLVREGI